MSKQQTLKSSNAQVKFPVLILLDQPAYGTQLIPLGVRDAFSPHAVLELISVSVGEVRIR